MALQNGSVGQLRCVYGGLRVPAAVIDQL